MTTHPWADLKHKKDEPKPLLIGFVLDESGSMQGIQQETVSGVNAYLDSLRKEPVETRLYLTLFSSMGNAEPRFRPYQHGAKAQDVAELTTAKYRPRGFTPLYDAIGNTIVAMGDLAAASTDWAVLVVIQTDGHENESREYTQSQINSLIKAKEAEGWRFIYLGADQSKMDAERAAVAMGMQVGSTVSYAKHDTASAYAALSGTTSSISRGPKLSSSDTAKLLDDKLEEEKNKKS